MANEELKKRVAGLTHNELVEALHAHNVVTPGKREASDWARESRATAEAAVVAAILHPQPEWDVVEGVKVLRIPGSQVVAVPHKGEKSKVWDILTLEPPRHMLTQLSEGVNATRAWLIKNHEAAK